MGRRFLSGRLVFVGICMLLACTRQSSDQTGLSKPGIEIPARGDSAWAVMVASGRFAARAAGDGPYFVEITAYERKGEDHLVTFSPRELILGGGGTVRVKPDGTTSIAVDQ